MYYVENNHPAIISREAFDLVRKEMTRRSSKRKVLQKSGKTELGKYSGKYALTELLVCGECGSPYKRVTWARDGKSASSGGVSPGWSSVQNTAMPRLRWMKASSTVPSSTP